MTLVHDLATKLAYTLVQRSESLIIASRRGQYAACPVHACTCLGAWPSVLL